jgi:hypothetical protein
MQTTGPHYLKGWASDWISNVVPGAATSMVMGRALGLTSGDGRLPLASAVSGPH